MTNEALARLPDPYRVKSGDTLHRIARTSGRTIQELQRLNKIRNADRLDVGQILYLSEATAFGLQVSFLDSLRHPIANLPFRILFDGRTVQGLTSSNGLVPQQVTRSARSQVDVWVQNAERQWTRVTSTLSGHGNKLITLVSDALVIKAQTKPHPASAPQQDRKPKTSLTAPTSQSPRPKPAEGLPIKNNPSIKKRAGVAARGQSIIAVGVDIPQGLLDLFGKFKSSGISEDEWSEIARDLNCEVAVLKAFSEVESGGKSSYWRLNSGDGAHIPAILYERHYFSRLTKRAYDKDHPDISWAVGYRKKDQIGKGDIKMHDGRIDADDVYSDFASSYLRLINAFRLSPESALRSCSWGKFQIMGDNFSLCGAADVDTFVSRMCTSEAEQISLVAEFIRNKPRAWKNPKNKSLGKEISLLDAVTSKNWQAIAFNYNGAGYKKFEYDTKLEAAYERHSRKA